MIAYKHNATYDMVKAAGREIAAAGNTFGATAVAIATNMLAEDHASPFNATMRKVCDGFTPSRDERYDVYEALNLVVRKDGTVEDGIVAKYKVDDDGNPVKGENGDFVTTAKTVVTDEARKLIWRHVRKARSVIAEMVRVGGENHPAAMFKLGKSGALMVTPEIAWTTEDLANADPKDLDANPWVTIGEGKEGNNRKTIPTIIETCKQRREASDTGGGDGDRDMVTQKGVEKLAEQLLRCKKWDDLKGSRPAAQFVLARLLVLAGIANDTREAPTADDFKDDTLACASIRGHIHDAYRQHFITAQLTATDDKARERLNDLAVQHNERQSEAADDSLSRINRLEELEAALDDMAA